MSNMLRASLMLIISSASCFGSVWAQGAGNAGQVSRDFPSELAAIPRGQCVPPQYSPTARAQEQVGTVRLRFGVGADGVPTYAYPLREGKPMIEELSLRYLGGCKFSPLLVAGVPTAVELTVPVEWKLDGVLDPVVQVTAECRPAYPGSATLRGAKGSTVISVRVSEQGDVLDAIVLTSSGHADLDQAAVMGIKRCKGKPGTSAGKPVEKSVRLAMEWRLD
jgi:TonB family protein